MSSLLVGSAEWRELAAKIDAIVHVLRGPSAIGTVHRLLVALDLAARHGPTYEHLPDPAGPTPGESRARGDSELDALEAKLREKWEAAKQRDERTARAVGEHVIACVLMEAEAKRKAMEKPYRPPRRVPGLSESERAARRAELAATADAARKKHSRRHYKTDSELRLAVHEQCAAEFGEIMGYAFREDTPIFRPWAEVSEPLNNKARAIYTELRKAITQARDFAYRLPGGCGGTPGRALFFMRGVLPVLRSLNESPFKGELRPGRAAFAREWADLVQGAVGRILSNRDLAVMTLLSGYCPRENYKTLLRDKPNGMTVAEVISKEATYVARARGKDSP
jgi:hypothetical protein